MKMLHSFRTSTFLKVLVAWGTACLWLPVKFAVGFLQGDPGEKGPPGPPGAIGTPLLPVKG